MWKLAINITRPDGQSYQFLSKLKNLNYNVDIYPENIIVIDLSTQKIILTRSKLLTQRNSVTNQLTKIPISTDTLVLGKPTSVNEIDMLTQTLVDNIQPVPYFLVSRRLIQVEEDRISTYILFALFILHIYIL